MSVVDRSGVVSISVGGAVQEMPYRRAVGLVATGRATFVTDESTPVVEKTRKSRRKSVEAPPVLPEQTSTFDGPLPPLPESAYGPDAVPIESAVSVPTPKGAEDEETEYLPSPPDQ